MNGLLKGITLFFKAFYKGMKIFGEGAVNVVNFFLLLIMYIFGVGISALLSKISGKKLLNLDKSNKKIHSYWLDKKNGQKLADFYKQF